MAGRRASRETLTREQWAARIAEHERGTPPAFPARAAISAPRIVEAALEVVRTEGFDDLTMRRVATALGTGPASLYAHVRNKSDLDDLLVAELLSRILVPQPDPNRWQPQFLDVCRQIRDNLLDYPGIARAALAGIPSSLEPLRVGEGLLSILLAGGIPPQPAAWASDAAFLYVTGYCLEAATARNQGEQLDARIVDRTEIRERLRMLPKDSFPNTIIYADELTAGDGHERFDFALTTLLRGLSAHDA
jgi:AcrR family transcriptional regulator